MVVGQTDEGKALVLAYGVDVPAMAAFMGTPEFDERTSGVHSGFTIYTVSEMAPPGGTALAEPVRKKQKSKISGRQSQAVTSTHEVVSSSQT